MVLETSKDISMQKTQLETLQKINEVLGLMEDSHKNKEWLFQQIKKQKLGLKIKRSMNTPHILSQCPDDFLSHLLTIMKGKDINDILDLSTLTRQYHWFFSDIVAGSDPTLPTKAQAKKIIVLNELIARTETFKNRDKNSTVILPTGDGMAIGFGDSPEHPLILSIQIHKALIKYNEKLPKKDKVLLRIGIDTGPVYVIKDLNGQDNVWGPGIIMTRRVMDLAGDMNIFASSRIAEDIRNLSPEYKEWLHPIGDYTIKHGEKLNLFNIYGEGFGNKVAPRKSKILQEKPTREDYKGVNSFEFKNIEIELNVLDAKTMLTHHTWTWSLVNISKEYKDQIFYYLEGDIPKDFADMNVKVTDDDGTQLPMISINNNKPTRKEFNVQFTKPLMPRQRKKALKLEYDWEEPERMFFYKLATNCKSFKYKFTIPKDVQIKSRVLQVDTEMGNKWHASPPPKIEFLEDITQITWEGKNLQAYDAYQFEW